MVKLGITGGIGSGKSYVARLLAERGIPVYDTDTEAKRLMITDEVIRERLIGLLGQEVYLADGALNKPLVADFLFASPGNAARINAIVHPRVKADFLNWAVVNSAQAIVALESAILFEAGFDDVVDYIVTVYAPVEVRLRRAMDRDAATEEKIRQRMAAQLDDEIKCRRSDCVIFNDGSLPLLPQLDNLQKNLEKSQKPATKSCVCRQ